MDNEEEKLIAQFITFFGMLGWTNEDNMAESADHPFPQPDALSANPDTLRIISPGIVIYLQAISAFVKTVRVDNLYISSSTTYDQLAEYNSVHRNSGVSSSIPKRVLETSKSDKPDKIPNFSVPKFNGDRI